MAWSAFVLLSYYLGLSFQINGRIRRWEAGRIGVGRGTRRGGTGNGRGKVGRGSSEKAWSGRNGGKLCNNAYNFAIEKGLKQGSQKKGAGPGMQGTRKREVWTILLKPLSQHFHIELFLFNILQNKNCSFFSSFGFHHFLGYVDTPESVCSDTNSYPVQ